MKIKIKLVSFSSDDDLLFFLAKKVDKKPKQKTLKTCSD